MSSIYDPQSQRDPRWAGQQMGACPGVAIGPKGCFITVAAMIGTHYHGSLFTPDVINATLKQRGLYANGCDYVDSSLPAILPEIQLEGVWNYAGIPADLSKLAMDDTQERLIVVDFDHNLGDGIQTHALRAYSWDGHTLIVDDPWAGTRDNFTKNYGTNLVEAIQKIVGYHIPGWSPPWKPHAAPPADPRDVRIADLAGKLAAATAAVVVLQGKLDDRDAKDVLRRAKAQELVALL